MMIITVFMGCEAIATAREDQVAWTAQKQDPGSARSTVNEEDSASIMVNEIARHLHKLTNKRVTVADFTDIEGNDLEEGKLFAEQVITRMLRHGGFRVIERSRLNKVLEEKKLSLAGITQEEEKEIGTLLNVDAIVSGTIVHFDDFEEIHARMIDVNTGEIYCAVEHRKGQQERRKEIAALPPEERQKVEKEFQDRETERKENPERYELETKHKEFLQQLKREDSFTFDRVIRTIDKLKRFFDENPRKYLLFTEPLDSENLTRLKDRKPDAYKDVAKFNKELKVVFKVSPPFKDLLQMQREHVMEKMKSR
ncbi:MAG: hypothetical protein JW932_00915 [Deltaproteobacteria bacterium]|nr:hypothetical protein [Deltaproteobacteria bacterium]